MEKDTLPKIIIHNSISIDGSLTNFEQNMSLHYQIAGYYKPDVQLIGSNTIKKGIELYEDDIPREEKKDFEKQDRSKILPYWVIIDTHGKLKGLLHTCRRFEFCKDVIILVSEKTPKNYLNYLKERNYEYHIVGKDNVNLKKALKLLSAKYKIKTILTDTGRILGNLLLNQGFVNEISLLIHPVIVGKKSYNMFSYINKNLKLKLIKKVTLENEYIWFVYKVKK
ncbi:MAG: RibD family protein [Thermoplasmatales archaeon]|nr:MAG: RibD family protein [Thermoplasmatales archaeon]